jgi:hypothetical protein
MVRVTKILVFMVHEQASLISGISGAVPKFPEINLEIVPKIRKFVACAGPEISLFSVISEDFGNLSLISLYWDGKRMNIGAV